MDIKALINRPNKTRPGDETPPPILGVLLMRIPAQRRRPDIGGRVLLARDLLKRAPDRIAPFRLFALI